MESNLPGSQLPCKNMWGLGWASVMFNALSRRGWLGCEFSFSGNFLSDLERFPRGGQCYWGRTPIPAKPGGIFIDTAVRVEPGLWLWVLGGHRTLGGHDGWCLLSGSGGLKVPAAGGQRKPWPLSAPAHFAASRQAGSSFARRSALVPSGLSPQQEHQAIRSRTGLES